MKVRTIGLAAVLLLALAACESSTSGGDVIAAAGTFEPEVLGACERGDEPGEPQIIFPELLDLVDTWVRYSPEDVRTLTRRPVLGDGIDAGEVGQVLSGREGYTRVLLMDVLERALEAAETLDTTLLVGYREGFEQDMALAIAGEDAAFVGRCAYDLHYLEWESYRATLDPPVSGAELAYQLAGPDGEAVIAGLMGTTAATWASGDGRATRM